MSDQEQDKEIQIKLVETSVNSGSLPITWCLSQRQLETYGVIDQWLLIAVAPPTVTGQNAEWRTYAKLSEMMAYITFLRPGKNRILVRVARSSEDVKEWMARFDGKWKYQAIAFPESWDDKDNFEYLMGFRWRNSSNPWDYIDVDMPADCFAREPWEIEKSWVNFFFRNKAVDQCEFRKRRLLAYTIQPLIFTLLILFRVLATAFFTLITARGVNYSAMFHPLTMNSADIWDNIDSSWLTIRKWPLPYRYLFNVLVPLTFVIGVLSYFIPLWTMLFWTFVPPLVAAFLYFGAVGLSWFLERFKVGRRINARFDAFIERRIEKRNQWEAKQVELLNCSSNFPIRRVKDLPKSKRSTKLRFYGVKSLICKPFAR